MSKSFVEDYCDNAEFEAYKEEHGDIDTSPYYDEEFILNVPEVDMDITINDLPETFVFPLLYRTNEKGQIWKYRVYFDGNQLWSIAGIYSPTKRPLDVFVNNSGRSFLEQVIIRARHETSSKIDEGYSRTPRQNDYIYAPMKGYVWKSDKHSDLMPCLATIKLNGNRAYAKIVNGQVELYSHSGKVFPFLDHIKADLTGCPDMMLDGELYTHGLTLQQIQSICRCTKNRHPDEGILQFHIFDSMIANVPYEVRYNEIVDTVRETDNIMICSNVLIQDESEVMEYYCLVLKHNYEGLMIRYTSKHGERSYYTAGRKQNLVKLKQFLEKEGVVIGWQESTGVRVGTPTLIVKDLETGVEFGAGITGMTVDEQKELLNNIESIIDCEVTYRYLEKTDGGCIRSAYVIGKREWCSK